MTKNLRHYRAIAICGSILLLLVTLYLIDGYTYSDFANGNWIQYIGLLYVLFFLALLWFPYFFFQERFRHRRSLNASVALIVLILFGYSQVKFKTQLFGPKDNCVFLHGGGCSPLGKR